MSNYSHIRQYLLLLSLLPVFAGANDNELEQTFHSYSSNLFMNAWELGQGGATVSSGRGSTGVMTNPAALGYSEMWEVGGNAGTILNSRAGGSMWVAWRVFMAGYGMMLPTTPLTRVATDRMESYIQSNFTSASNLAFLGIGVSPWKWISVGARGNYITDSVRLEVLDTANPSTIGEILTFTVPNRTADAGIQLRFDWFNLGVAFRNWGSRATAHSYLSDTSGAEPRKLIVGINPAQVLSTGLALTAVNNLVISAQIDRANDKTGLPWIYKGGVQVRFNPWLTGRVGYDSELGDQTGGGVCLGTGMKFGDYVLDIALVEGTRHNENQRYSFSALASFCYYMPYTGNSPWRVVYSRKHYDDESLLQIRTLKDNSRDYELKGNFKKALEMLDVLLVWNPEDYEARLKYQELTENVKVEQAYALLTTANDFFNNGEYTDALHDGLAAKKLSPDDPYIDEFIAGVRSRLKDVQNTRPEWLQSLFYEADDAYANGDFDLAANKYADILAVDAGNMDAQTGLDKSVARSNKFISVKLIQAKQAELAKRYDEAITEYQAVLDVTTDNGEAQAGYAICQKAKSDRVRSLLNTAMDCFEVDEFDAAEAHLKTVLYIDSGNYTARNYMNNIEHARAENPTIASDPTKSFGTSDLYQLGVTAYSRFDYLIAEGFWSQIPDGDAYYEKAQMNMARAQARMEEFSK